MNKFLARQGRLRTTLVAAAATLALAGCFGGGGDDDDDNNAGAGSNTPPASASASTDGFLAFIVSLAGGMFDNAEPFDLSNFTLPTDNADNREPIPTPVDAGT